MADISQYFQTFRRRIATAFQRTGNQWRAFWQTHPRLRLAGKLAAGAALLGLVLLFVFAFLVYQGSFGHVPTYGELREIQNYTASEVYSEDEVLLGKYYIENRVNADFDEITPDIINALVATEDARFFEHGGIDLRAWMRVLVKTVLLADESSGGGSTLSQQLAKNLFPREDWGLLTLPVAKFKEMYIARRLENLYTKRELINLYLNTVPFGENIYGIKVASRRFFNKSPDQLQLEEAAVLVGMLKANTYYNPARNPDHALGRRNTVLNQMAKYDYLTPAVCDSLKKLPIKLDYRRDGSNRGLATYFREHLRMELEEVLEDHTKPDGTPYNLYTDGLRIFTSLDSRMQRYAEEAVAEHMSELQKDFEENWASSKRLPWGRESVLQKAVEESERYQALKERGFSKEAIDKIFNTPFSMVLFDWEEGEVRREMTPLDSVKFRLTILNTGFLAMEPESGMIRAWVGGIDHEYFQYDHVKSRRQVGSTIKPVVYATAIQNGMLPCEYTQNRLVTYQEYDNWEPRNSDGEYGGVYSMEGALSHSVNTVTVEVMLRAGIDSVALLAREMGISSPIPTVPAIGLGAVEASLWDMVRLYGTFANRGRRPDLHYLDRIETAEGEVLVSFDRPNARRFPRVLREDQADMMIKLLESVVDSGTARRLKYEFRLYNDIAGKTGTTQYNTDGWFLGFTPNLVAGAWVGADNPRVHFRSMRVGQGSNSALPIWGRFMRKVYDDPELKKLKYAKFREPNDTIRALMACPPFLEEMPIMAEYQDDYQDNPEFFNRLYNDLASYRDQEIQVELKRRRRNETDAEYYDRMRRYNERLLRRDQRREKLKEAWNNFLFGDQKEN